MIREFNPSSDSEILRECIIELQNYECQFDSRMLKGEQIADDYTTNMLEKCRKYNGIILVVDTESGVAGYLTLLINVPTEEIYDGKYEYALVSDIVVLERFKGRGYGKLLLNEATRIARDKNAKWLRLQVLSENQIAKTLYKQADFQELYVDMEKDLQDDCSGFKKC